MQLDIGTIMVSVLSIVIAALAVAHALLNKRHPRAAFGWIAVSIVFPIAGGILYYLFGINRIRTRARRLRRGQAQALPPDLPQHPAPPQLRALSELGHAISAEPLTSGNQVSILHNGEQAYPVMLEAIEQAKHYIYLTTFIFDTDDSGMRFITALQNAQQRGVDVRVLIDGMGALYSRPRAHRLLRQAKVPVTCFLPPRLWPPTLNINLRNHRKILIVDGARGFTGGMNIGDRHLAMSDQNSQRVIDIHFELKGPILDSLTSLFEQDWQFATSSSGTLPRRHSKASGEALCRLVPDGPGDDLDRLPTLLVGAISVAQHRVIIMSPYFLPPRELIGALQAAALRGVTVDIFLPANNNLPYVHRATRHMLWELLQYDVHVYFQPGPFVHSKLLVIDDEYAQIGSANMDPRSLRLNFELTVEIYHRPFVAEINKHIESVRSNARPITNTELKQRPLVTRLVDGVAWLFTPYL